jgi:hypothetical protein
VSCVLHKTTYGALVTLKPASNGRSVEASLALPLEITTRSEVSLEHTISFFCCPFHAINNDAKKALDHIIFISP